MGKILEFKKEEPTEYVDIIKHFEDYEEEAVKSYQEEYDTRMVEFDETLKSIDAFIEKGELSAVEKYKENTEFALEELEKSIYTQGGEHLARDVKSPQSMDNTFKYTIFAKALIKTQLEMINAKLQTK